MWVATNKDGSQTWFVEKPVRNNDYGIWRGKLPIYNTEYYGYFLEQTWEDDPIEVSIIETFRLQSLRAIK